MNQPVENSEIVKGYEYTKGKYLIVEPDEIANLRIETKNVIDVQQFVDLTSCLSRCLKSHTLSSPSPRSLPTHLLWFAKRWNRRQGSDRRDCIRRARASGRDRRTP